MRDIKFRAWNDIDKTMIEWKTIKCFPTLLSNLVSGKVKHHTVMQYTGLTDVNGVEIYEGDILHAWVNKGYQIEHEGELMTAYKKTLCSKPRVVEFIRGSFRINNPKDPSDNYYGVIDYSSATLPNDLEVIGNIYQHPHLLEQ